MAFIYYTTTIVESVVKARTRTIQKLQTPVRSPFLVVNLQQDVNLARNRDLSEGTSSTLADPAAMQRAFELTLIYDQIEH